MGLTSSTGNPPLFGTTEDFLRKFGVQSIEDLPSITSDKYEDFKNEAEEEVQLKFQV